MPPELRKRKLSNLEHVPVLTCTLGVDKTCTYAKGSFPHFKHFEDKIHLVGGINVPKLVECMGSDGRCVPLSHIVANRNARVCKARGRQRVALARCTTPTRARCTCSSWCGLQSG
jgi:hypothetical protein